MILRFLLGAGEWALAIGWITRAAATLYHLGDVPDLTSTRYSGQGVPLEAGPEPSPGTGVVAGPPTEDFAQQEQPASPPLFAVIVPALNEAEAIGGCLRSLLASQGVQLEIIAVDDRSTDGTGEIMDSLAAEVRKTGGPHTLRVLHVTELPEGWLGKPHALALGAGQTNAPFVLFTDADAFYAPDALARVARFMTETQADHLVLLPTPILKTVGERMMLGMMQALAIWPVRLWKVPDPNARDSIGVGCFNLLRRSAYEQIGGFQALHMEVLEDLRLGFLVKQCGLRQRVAFGSGLLCLHWASGAVGIVRGLTKNFFAMCRYRLLLMVAAVFGTALLTLGPWVGLLGPQELPSLLVLLVLAGVYLRNAGRTGISAGYVLLFPVASCFFLYGMVRSTVITLAQGGVRWRDTFYPLDELRRNAGPLR